MRQSVHSRRWRGTAVRQSRVDSTESEALSFRLPRRSIPLLATEKLCKLRRTEHPTALDELGRPTPKPSQEPAVCGITLIRDLGHSTGWEISDIQAEIIGTGEDF